MAGRVVNGSAGLSTRGSGVATLDSLALLSAKRFCECAASDFGPRSFFRPSAGLSQPCLVLLPVQRFKRLLEPLSAFHCDDRGQKDGPFSVTPG